MAVGSKSRNTDPGICLDSAVPEKEVSVMRFMILLLKGDRQIGCHAQNKIALKENDKLDTSWSPRGYR